MDVESKRERVINSLRYTLHDIHANLAMSLSKWLYTFK
jgi:hypothetical protein